MKTLLLWSVQGYRQVISPLLPPTCRFRPTCSQYALVAIERFGAVRGSWLAMKRILRCHPFHPGGYDPVPEVFWTIDNTKLETLIQSSHEPGEEPTAEQKS